MKITVPQLALVLGSALALTACGPKLESVTGSGKSEASTPVDERRETVTVSVGVAEGAGFSLAAATGYNMALEGCVSGLSNSSITQAVPSVDVYKFDQNCLVKLTSFTYGNITYIPSSGDPFSSWIAGDVATFEESGNPTNTLRVVVASQLGSPISGTESVSYSFSQIVAGANSTLAKEVVGDNHALSVSGQDATPLTVAGLSFTGMTSTGAGQFIFTLECGDNVSGTAPALSCAGTSLGALKYKLVKDTYSSVLTLAQAAAIFDGSEQTVADADKLGLGQGGTTKGGFITKSGASVLTGPDQMHANPNMLLVIQVAGISYRYFNVDVTTLTYGP